jgi:hypothetical protein
MNTIYGAAAGEGKGDVKGDVEGDVVSAGTFFAITNLVVIVFELGCIGCALKLKMCAHFFFRMRPNTFAVWWTESTVFSWIPAF